MSISVNSAALRSVVCKPSCSGSRTGKLRIHAAAVPPKREAQAVKQTVGGGGYSGYCDIESIKNLQIECAGLEGDAMEACWADFGCDVNEVTRHYSSVLADIKKQQDGHREVPWYASRGHGRLHTKRHQ